MLALWVVLGALPAAQVDGGLSAVTVQELIALNANTTNLCFGSGAHDRVSVSWVVAAGGGTPVECTLDAQEPLGECLRRAVCAWRFPASASPTLVRGTWEGMSPPLRPPLRASEPAVEAAIEAQLSGLADCAQLGKLVARLTVGSEGTVLGATFPFRSDTLSAQTETCALGVVAGWRLPVAPRGPFSVEASFLFAQTSERFALLGEEAGHRVITPLSPRKALDRDTFTSVRAALVTCSVRGSPSDQGRLRLNFHIGPAGASTVDSEGSSALSAGFVDCVVAALGGLEFPPSPLAHEFSYSIAFRSADGGT